MHFICHPHLKVRLFLLIMKLLVLRFMCVLLFKIQDIGIKKVVVKVKELHNRTCASPLCINWQHSNICS